MRKSQRSSRVECLKESILQRNEEIQDLRCQSSALKTAVNKANIKKLKKSKMCITSMINNLKLQEAELENVLLRDPNSRASRLQHLGYPTTLATSGHFGPSATSLLSCIKIISNKAFLSESKQLGAGRFGLCYLCTLGHYKTCVKVFKRNDNSAFCHKANILSNFIHPNLSYLFGCV